MSAFLKEARFKIWGKALGSSKLNWHVIGNSLRRRRCLKVMQLFRASLNISQSKPSTNKEERSFCAETCQLRRLDKNCQIFMQDVEKFRIIQTRVPLFFLFLMAIILSLKDCNEIAVKVESGGCLRSADVRRWRGGCHFRSRLNRLRCARGRKSVLTVADRCAQQLRQDNYRRHDETTGWLISS